MTTNSDRIRKIQGRGTGLESPRGGQSPGLPDRAEPEIRAGKECRQIRH